MKNLRSLAVLLIAIPLSGLYGEDSAYTGSAQYTGIVKFYGNGSIIVIPPMANLLPADFHWTVDADTAVTGAVKQWDLVSIQGDYTPDKQPGHLKVLTLVQSSLGQRAVIDAPPDESGTLYVRNLQGKEAV